MPADSVRYTTIRKSVSLTVEKAAATVTATAAGNAACWNRLQVCGRFRDTVRSWVETAPGISVTPGAGAAAIQWTNVSGIELDARSYGVQVAASADESASIWRSSEELPLTQSSIAFNMDETATGSLVSGQAYEAEVTVFDRYGNYAFRTYEFTMP